MLGIGLNKFGIIPLGYFLSTGVPLWKIISGVFSCRLRDDTTGQFIEDDATGARIYAEVTNG